MRPMKPHLSIRIQENNQTIRNQPVDDPFIHTTIRPRGFWTALQVLFGRYELRVKVMHDSVSQARWFGKKDLCSWCKTARIDDPRHDGYHDAGYHHGEERLCEKCGPARIEIPTGRFQFSKWNAGMPTDSGAVTFVPRLIRS